MCFTWERFLEGKPDFCSFLTCLAHSPSFQTNQSLNFLQLVNRVLSPSNQLLACNVINYCLPRETLRAMVNSEVQCTTYVQLT